MREVIMVESKMHFQDRDGRYMCNKAVAYKKEKMTKDKHKVNCKNCLKNLKYYEWGGGKQ
jgi:hypothetical protein